MSEMIAYFAYRPLPQNLLQRKHVFIDPIMSAKNIRLYYAALTLKECVIDHPETYHYLAHVLRVRVGSVVHVFNEQDGEWRATVQSITKKEMVLVLQEQLHTSYTQPPLIVGIPVIRPALFELMLDMGTQCGVTDFVPITFQFGQKYSYKEDRVHRILQEATEQSGRFDKPQMHGEQKLADFVNQYAATLCVAVEPMHGVQIQTIAGKSALLIGPEGGFAPEELKSLQQSEATLFTIPGPILRTETALPVAVGFMRGHNTFR